MLIEKLYSVLNELLIARAIKRVWHILVIDTFHALAEGRELVTSQHRPIQRDGGVRCAMMDADCGADVLEKVHG